MSASWMPELLKQSRCPSMPLGMGIHFSHKKCGCPEVTLRQDITDPKIFTPGYFEGCVCQAWLHLRCCRSHEHQSEALFDWSLWSPLELVRRVLLENIPHRVWGRWLLPWQISPFLVWSRTPRIVHYSIPLDLHSIHTLASEIRSSYWPMHQSIALKFTIGLTGPTEIDASVGSQFRPDNHFTTPVHRRFGR